MKQFFLLLAISVYLGACTMSHELKKHKQLTPGEVQSMVDEYYHVPPPANPTYDITKNIVRMVTLPTKEINKLTRYQQDFRLIVGAYTTNQPEIGKVKGDVALILQLWRKKLPKYYDLIKIFKDRETPKDFIAKDVLCPPPPGCDYKVPPTD